MSQVEANGLSIEVETHGNSHHPPLLMVRGLGTQLVHWSAEIVQGFVDAGFFVITFDNRDVGLSQKFDQAGAPDIGQLRQSLAAGTSVEAPYTVHDMAADGIGVLDALGIGEAHIFGNSMGGMIVQLMAANYPDRVLTMTSVMSSSGADGLPSATREAQKGLVQAPKSRAREDVVANDVETEKIWASPKYPESEQVIAERAGLAYDRCYCPEGVTRQLAAVLATGDRASLLESIKAPSLIIHGDADTLVPVEHGIDCAEKIPGARLEIIEGMGHDLPLSLNERIVTLVADHALRKEPA